MIILQAFMLFCLLFEVPGRMHEFLLFTRVLKKLTSLTLYIELSLAFILPKSAIDFEGPEFVRALLLQEENIVGAW